jgi:hypothetical protein
MPAPEPLRAPTAEDLALEAKKRQAAELRRQLDQVLAEVDGHKAWLAPKATALGADAAPAELLAQQPREAWREAGPQPQFKVQPTAAFTNFLNCISSYPFKTMIHWAQNRFHRLGAMMVCKVS